jgi:tetratricopeptide (TPR) repeat protein
MINDYDGINDDDQESIKRFETMLKSGENFFLDTDTFDYLIEYYIEQMQFEKALFTCEKATEQHPYSISYMIHKARVLNAKGESAEAVKVIKKADELQPNDPELMVAKGVICSDLGKYYEAIEYFEKALLFWDEKHEINYQIAICYLQLEDFKQARKYFLRALRLRPESPDVLNDLVYCLSKMRRQGEIIDLYRQYAEEFPEDNHYQILLGKALLTEGRFDEAKLCLEQAEALSDNAHDVKFLKAKLYSMTESYQAAYELLTEIKESFGSSEEYFFEFAMTCEALERLPEAFRAFKKVTEINPKNFKATYAIGNICEKMSRYKEGAYYYEKAAKLQPENAVAWYSCAKCYEFAEDPEKAEECYEKAVAVKDAPIEIFKSYAIFLLQTNESDKAVALLEEATVRFLDDAELIYCLACALMNIKRIREALHYLEQAVALDYASHSVIFEIFEKKEVQIALFKIIEELHNSNK